MRIGSVFIRVYPWLDSLGVLRAASNAILPVLSRAGGMVINEILASRLPPILVSFPLATDNHQETTPQHVARKGASSQINQSRWPELVKMSGRPQDSRQNTACSRQERKSCLLPPVSCLLL